MFEAATTQEIQDGFAAAHRARSAAFVSLFRRTRLRRARTVHAQASAAA